MLKKDVKFARVTNRLLKKKVPCHLNLYQFPVVKGLEDVTGLLNKRAAADLFEALHHAFPLQPITAEKSAKLAERMIEYLGRAFEHKVPLHVEYYQHILLMLLKEYDDKYYINGAETMAPHELLKAFLEEAGLTQKSLVPDCFKTSSQVSEFLHQKKGRKILKYDQAVALGEKFQVNPTIFLRKLS